MGEDVDGFLASLDESGGNFIDKVDLLYKHSGEGMANNREILEFHVILHSFHGEITAQNFKIPEAFMSIIVHNVTTFRQNLN